MLRDRRILYTTAFLRALATGMMGVLLGIYLARMAFTPSQIGLVISAGLAGATLAALLVTFAGDRLGRRRLLFWLAFLSALGGAAAAWYSSPIAVGIAAFIGMLNGMGRDRGAALVLEQAIIPATATDQERTRAFAWYNVLQDIGHGVGGLLAALPSVLRMAGIGELASFQAAVMLYALLLFATAVLYLRLSAQAEAPLKQPRLVVSPHSRKVLWRISLLFGLDSVAGGFVGTALLSYFFYQRFGVSESLIAVLFLGARGMNAISHLGAAWLAKRIGLVNTMVFTHIPSSLLLVTVAFAPNFWVAAVLFLLREGLVEMDVPTRQSYVMAMVRPEERTFASGVTHLVRLGGWAVAPSFAGFLMQFLALSTPLFIGAGMKIAYDVMLYRAFRGLKPPEERER
ncbi:MFS transporter [Sulfuricella sp.]|uniref:MFS transporter n=1 Tax=Sulfuricella sp. TaxID=2099377 RepID=UPI002BF885A6|nr:MFS transporter [Sulfuricella sp.]HUX63809.1 MFS transporter [Sulfuricella sp.]